MICGIRNPHLSTGLGGIQLNANRIDPNRWDSSEFDLSNDAIPNRLRILDVGVGATDIELLAVVHADDEFVATGGNGSQVKNMRSTK